MRTFFAIALVLFTLTACRTTDGYEEVLNSWVGSHVDQLVLSWGPPVGSHRLTNGDTIVQYDASRNVQVGGFSYTVPKTTYSSGTVSGTTGSAFYSGSTTTYETKRTPVQNINMRCVTNFVVGPRGTIKSWRYQGNDCRA